MSDMNETTAIVLGASVGVLADLAEVKQPLAEAWHELTPAERAEVYGHMAGLENLVKAIKKATLESLQDDPDSVEGLEISTTPGSIRKKIPDPAAAAVAMQELLTPQQFIACCSASLPALQDAVRDSWTTTKDQAKEMVEEALDKEGLIVRKRSAGTTRIVKSTRIESAYDDQGKEKGE